MWATVLALALVATIDPVRIGFAALVISRPRPILNLFAFWLGGIAMGIATGLTVLFVLRDHALTIMDSVVSWAETPTGGRVQLVIGVLALVLAALMVVALSAFRRTPVPTLASEPSASGLPPDPLLSRLPKPVQDLIEGGALWVSFVAGIMMATPVEYAVALAAILASGAGATSQVVAVAVFTSVAFVIAEIPLVGHLVAPGRTQVVVLQVHKWVRAHRLHVIAVIVAAVGVFLVTHGAGSV